MREASIAWDSSEEVSGGYVVMDRNFPRVALLYFAEHAGRLKFKVCSGGYGLSWSKLIVGGFGA